MDNFEASRILVADDDRNTVTKIKSILEENGCRNVTGKSRISTLAELKDFEIVILDIVWRGNTKPKYQEHDYFGISAAKYLREASPNCKIILMSKFFYELDQLKEISLVCDEFFSSNGDATEIFRTIMKITSISAPKSDEEGELFSRAVLLAKQILQEVDGDTENKPSLVGISNQVHAELSREIKSIVENQHREHAILLKESINNIAMSLTSSAATISGSLLELFQEIKLMANDPKVQMNFNAPVSVAAGNVERDLLVNPTPKTPEEAARELQDLLTHLQESNPTDLEAAVEQEIRRNPTFRSRLRNALKEAGLETAKVLFAPLGIGIEAVRGWHDAE
jgi:DNA-binding NarL/FixJ family response regulator